MTDSHQFLGKGIYSVPEAANLTGLKPRQIRRWVTGYDRQTHSHLQHHEAVFRADYDCVGHRVSLSFLDLIEIMFVDSFRKHGVSWQSIRVAARKAASMLEFSHPFTKRVFFTDGTHILTRIAHTLHNAELLNLINDQYEMDHIVSPLLYNNLDFGDLDVAARWWPKGHEGGVVVDPARNMGKPTIADHNIPTAVLAQLFETTHSADEVADWYEIDAQSVLRAVDFETSLAA